MSNLYITYWTGTDRSGGNSPGNAIVSETLAISGTSAQAGATPDGAGLVSIYADVAGCYQYGANPTAVSGPSTPIFAGERLWENAKPGKKIAGITA